MTSQGEREFVAELGKLAGAAVCAVIDYIDTNSINNQNEVEEAFVNFAVKLTEGD